MGTSNDSLNIKQLLDVHLRLSASTPAYQAFYGSALFPEVSRIPLFSFRELLLNSSRAMKKSISICGAAARVDIATNR